MTLIRVETSVIHITDNRHIKHYQALRSSLAFMFTTLYLIFKQTCDLLLFVIV